MRGIIFLLVIVGVILLEFYVFSGIREMTKNLSSTLQTAIHFLYWLLPLSIVLGIVLIITGVVSRGDKVGSQVFFTLLYLNFFPKLLFGAFLGINDLSRVAMYLVDLISKTDNKVSFNSRNNFLLKTGLIASALPVYSVIRGITKGAHDYKVHRIKIRSNQIPKAFDGFKIVQLSDIHAGSFFDFNAVKKGIEKIKHINPDLFLFTGDLVNNVAAEVEPYLDLFSQIPSKHGKFSVLGNHDYGDYVAWPSATDKNNNLEKLKNHHASMGWDLLLDENRSIDKDGQKIQLIGVENWGDGFVKKGDLKKAYQGVDKNTFSILLSHDPTHWDAQVKQDYTDINLTLSGHTHGMQMGIENKWLKWSPASLRYKQWGGLYGDGGQQIYVNRGFGYLAFPGRMGIRPEITLIELQSS